MSPSEVQELIDIEPFIPLRLTLASGSVIELWRREGLSISDLTLSVVDTGPFGKPRLQLVSIPNICLIVPILRKEPDRLAGVE